ncbi:hypothetical protein ACFB49_42530 [Sphingomonas sp. DBB INV C78]|uniref:hypothetical protein n=1 Tax=Sphingomonas sp. DBB INV C78 TaxID=3349434 RepID=UPI0036D38F08
MDQTIRPANVAVLFKLETTEGVDASPSPTADAIPVEADSIEYNSPWTQEQSNEATGSLVAGAPLIIGQAATISFRSRRKGAGAGVTYSSTVKPPLHQVYQACGKRGLFTAAIAAALATAGGATSVTLPASFPATAKALMGMPLVIGAGVGVGRIPHVIDYTAGRVATLSENFSTPLDATTSISLPANWTYAGTSPRDAAARATDHPSGTIYIYEDGTLLKFVGCRGVMTGDGQSARPGYDAFQFTGVYAGKTDTALPSNLVVANHSAPVLVQGSEISPAVLLNRKPLPISTWSWENGGDIEVPEDPNTSYGFGPGVIAGRVPLLRLDPLATLVAVRDSIADIGAGLEMSAVLRAGSVAGNRWSQVHPLAQKVEAAPGRRGNLRSEQLVLQAKSAGLDAQTRDSESILAFY